MGKVRSEPRARWAGLLFGPSRAGSTAIGCAHDLVWAPVGIVLVAVIVIANVVGRGKKRQTDQFLGYAISFGFQPLPVAEAPPMLASLVPDRPPKWLLWRRDAVGDAWVSYHYWLTGGDSTTHWHWLTFLAAPPGLALPDVDVIRRFGMVAGRSGLLTGDPAFDQAYVVSSRDPNAAAALGPQLRQMAVASALPEFGVRGGVVWLRRPEAPRIDVFPLQLQALTAVATMLRDRA